MELHTVSEWLKASCLTLNAKETKFCIFGTRPKIAEFGNYQLMIDGVELEHVRSFKYLVMILDETLSFTEHIDHLHKKPSGKLGVLHKARPHLKTRLLLCQGLICSHIDYGDIIYCTASKKNL